MMKKLLVSAKVGHDYIYCNGKRVDVTHVEVENYPSPEDVKALILSDIQLTCQTTKEYVSQTLSAVYGRSVPVDPHQVGDLLIAFKQVETDTGTSVVEVGRRVRLFVDRDNRLFPGGQPVPLDRIARVFLLLQNKRVRFQDVKKILRENM